VQNILAENASKSPSFVFRMFPALKNAGFFQTSKHKEVG